MCPHRLGWGLLAGFLLAASSAALAQDAQKCFAASDRVKDGDTLDDAEKRAAHDACMRALADSSNIVQKYHLQRPISTSWAIARQSSDRRVYCRVGCTISAPWPPSMISSSGSLKFSMATVWKREK